MAHIIREIIKPGLYVFKVFNRSGALMYHGSNEDTAVAMKASLETLEEKYAREARETGSSRSSD
tara:strand:+ start:1405 stop:1596 length:192 start_codon:yes stop_codon:yes gene_type:complete